MGYSPWGHKELDTTEVTEHTLSWLFIHEITRIRNAEPDACLGTWQATGAAAISKLDHESASEARSLHRSVADSL